MKELNDEMNEKNEMENEEINNQLELIDDELEQASGGSRGGSDYGKGHL